MLSDATRAGTACYEARLLLPTAILCRVAAATAAHERLYRPARSFYTALVIKRKPLQKFLALILYTAASYLFSTEGWGVAAAQQAQEKPATEPAAKNAEKADKSEKAAHPAQIELLETKVRFETNGDSRKEVHALVKINSELGVRQFAQLNFDFNRSFESVEIPMAHITHANGGTSDILPSAVSDRPNPAVVNAPAYQDVRVKSVRILGLQPGDTLEYRVVRTVSHHPLAPDFWLEHSFDRTGVVTHEIFELDLPAASKTEIRINPATPATISENSSSSQGSRLLYRWQWSPTGTKGDKEPKATAADVIVTTFSDWDSLSIRLADSLLPPAAPSKSRKKAPTIEQEAKALCQNAHSLRDKLEAIYDFVSQKIATVELSLGMTEFVGRSPDEILASHYATAEDKYVLFEALLQAVADDGSGNSQLGAYPELVGTESDIKDQLPRPSLFTNLLISVAFVQDNSVYWLDPTIEVAPFNMLASNYRGAHAFFIARKNPNSDVIGGPWDTIPDKLPFAASQNVAIDATLGSEGKLKTKVHYSMRGDNELVLRLAFHKTPKERWKEVAQLLSLTDGFRGQVSSVTASDPYTTKEPFTVEYELEQAKFVDWSKKPVRIPALLPQLGLPDPPAKSAAGSATAPIELGTPLEVEAKMTLHLPPGTSASAPAGTSVERDYATYASQYSVTGSTLAATRRIKFVLREIPGVRAADYNAFLRAVQNDETQDFTLERTEPVVPKANSTPPQTGSPKP